MSTEISTEKPITKFNFREPCSKQYIILGFGKPIIPKMGVAAGKEKNMYWKVYDKLFKTEYYIMYASGGVRSDDVYFKFSIESINKVINAFDYRPIWYNTPVGYIATTNKKRDKYYLHQILMDHFGKGKGQMSVDHINRDKLDNRLENLRITDQSEQNRNCGKRNRKYNARSLPKELEGITLPKFVVYYYEITNKETGAWREFFKVEKHPGCPPNKSGKRIWIGSKSKKISLLDRLETAKHMCKQFDKNIEKEIKVV